MGPCFSSLLGNHRRHNMDDFDKNLRKFSSKYALTGSDRLGEGGFGEVFPGKDLETGMPVVVKFVHANTGIPKNAQGIPKEVANLQKVQSVNGVIQLLDHYSMDRYITLVFESVPNAIDLYDYISDNGSLDEWRAKLIFGQLVEILQGIRKKGVLHGDIKDENIIIDTKTLRIKLIDFGGSATYDDHRVYTRFAGTNVYAPPEYFTRGEYTADGLNVWSLGILLYDMLFGDVPFKTDVEIQEAKLSLDNGGISEEVRHLLRRCLKVNPEDRIPLDKILDHIWFDKML